MTMVQSNMLVLRAMTADDAAIVARLHAASWRTAYRGILSDEYLAGEVELERIYAWTKRFERFDDTQFGVIASFGVYPVGFVFVLCDVDAVYGNLVDNLHVAPEARSAGIGPQLLAAAAAGIEERRWNRRVHLWVWDANMRARAFYKRMGGREVESTLKSAPDGTEAKSWRVVWDDVSALQLQQRNTA
jgi:ribosomal protein S18 acetylase RimI-like enzyme